MLIRLRDESGRTEEASFLDMDVAAKWCVQEYPEYRDHLIP